MNPEMVDFVFSKVLSYLIVGIIFFCIMKNKTPKLAKAVWIYILILCTTLLFFPSIFYPELTEKQPQTTKPMKKMLQNMTIEEISNTGITINFQDSPAISFTQEHINLCPMIDKQIEKILTDVNLQYAILLLSFYRQATDSTYEYCKQYYIPNKHITVFEQEFQSEKQNAENIFIKTLGKEALECYNTQYYDKIFKPQNISGLEHVYQTIKERVENNLKTVTPKAIYSRYDFCKEQDESIDENIKYFRQTVINYKLEFNQPVL